MKQLTIRGFDSELERRLHSTARRRECSLNKAAVYLMRRGAGLQADSNTPDTIGSSLDEFIGTWTPDQAREFDASVADLSTVDEEFWK